ncbi:GntR family transcriptional regulator [Mycolicibacterium sp.]|uniref:GntR family transcriptional regulator n=1 Tax=Mycolicibacterium sp. TaxID=2320850 RepID=UPI003D13CF9D
MTGDVSAAAPLRSVAAPLRRQLVERLREAIVAAEYPPGDRLVERALTERYGVSRTVVREALRQLESEGLVTTVANRGPVVAVLSADDAAALYELRSALETLAAERFAERADARERAALRAAFEQLSLAFAVGGMEAWLAAKDEFYEALLTGAHNDVVRATLIGLHARVQRLRGLSLRRPGRQAVSLAELELLTDAAVAGRVADAGAAAKVHIERAGAAALAELSATWEAPQGKPRRKGEADHDR